MMMRKRERERGKNWQDVTRRRMMGDDAGKSRREREKR